MQFPYQFGKNCLPRSTRIKKIKPWNFIDSNDVIALKLPDDDFLVYCSILGQRGEEFGLAVYLGEIGLRNLEETLTYQTDEEFMYKQRALHISFSARGELSDSDYELLIENGFRYRGKEQCRCSEAYPLVIYHGF